MSASATHAKLRTRAAPGGRTWIIGWHPNGASHRGYGPAAYTEIIAGAVAMAERPVPP